MMKVTIPSVRLDADVAANLASAADVLTVHPNVIINAAVRDWLATHPAGVAASEVEVTVRDIDPPDVEGSPV